MKITAFYYLQYPDCSPANPLHAMSEVYVEVKANEGTTYDFDFTYTLTVCTVGFLKHYLESHPYFAARSLIVVERFEDQVIKEALEAILPMIEDVAVRK